jgi:beta-xylosidase
MFTNPVYEHNFPDPFILKVGGTYYAYATNGENANIQTLHSTDLVHWTPGADALPEIAPWSRAGLTWAPEVLRRDDGRYVLFYTGRSTADNLQCIGRALADRPEGPFTDQDQRPFVCQTDLGGSIDPSPFRDDDGALYLLWKNDGNCCGLPTSIYAQRLAPDAMTLQGSPVEILQRDAAWEGALIEAPTMWKRDGRYFLFFSANAYDSAAYAVGYAHCDGPLGPCRAAPNNPILHSSRRAAGPGHQAIIAGPAGDTWIVYHPWPPETIGMERPGRLLWIDRLLWQDGEPVVHGPTDGPQPEP